MKHCLVLGGAGFIGTHLVKRLKEEGHWVRVIDRKAPEFEKSVADEFNFMDLRALQSNDALFSNMDEIYQLACEVGGLGYIMNKNNDAQMLYNSMRINMNVAEACRAQGVGSLFFASSACVYPSTSRPHNPLDTGYRIDYLQRAACREEDSYPARPDNEYAWEKLFAERLYDAYARRYNMNIHIGRFHNCYGPLGTWQGGREKAPAAICRKIAQLPAAGGEIEIWGDGTQTRSFMLVDDAVEGMTRLIRSDFRGPVNIGSSEMVMLKSLIKIVAQIAGKRVTTRTVDGPVGVNGRNSDNTLIKEKLGWEPKIPLWQGIERTYPWVEQQLLTTRQKSVV